ncbi:MAG: flagellar motor protein MotB [Rhodobacteraceae bacterium]|nr:flagellar motor protein MotB [Paracoccaceae bacterium]
MAENSGDNLRPIIIIKRKKIIAAGHHGGAWKVAYADFVTAMMAFFLLMWLLNATSEEQRQGIAAYFNPGIPIFTENGGGAGMFGGDTVHSEDTQTDVESGTVGEQAEDITGQDGSTGTSPDDASDAQFADVENMFRGNTGESWVEDPLLQHVSTRVTDEGLIIDVFDLPDSPLYEPGTNQPTKKMFALLKMISRVFGSVTNNIAITGHIDVEPELDGGPDGFALTGGRALIANAIMVEHGVDAQRFERLTGASNRTPVGEDAPAYRNRRLEIVLLRSDRRN